MASAADKAMQPAMAELSLREADSANAAEQVAVEKDIRIDMHTHILPRQWPDLVKKYGYPGWTSLQVEDPVRCARARDNVLHFVRAKLTVQLVRSVAPVPHGPSQCKCYTSYGGTALCGVGKMLVDGKPFRDVQSTTWSPEDRIKDCDNTQVRVQVLSTVPVMFSYWAKPDDTLDLARYLNDHIAQTVSENPKRFIGSAPPAPLPARCCAVRLTVRLTSPCEYTPAQASARSRCRRRTWR